MKNVTAKLLEMFVLRILFKAVCIISIYLNGKQKSIMGFSAKIVNFQKTDNEGPKIHDETLHIRYGEVKHRSKESEFTAPNR